MSTMISTLLVVVSIGMWLKLVEMALHMVRFYPVSTVAGGTPSVNIDREWPVTAFVARIAIYLPRCWRPYLFRYRMLMFLLVSLSIFTRPGALALFTGF